MSHAFVRNFSAVLSFFAVFGFVGCASESRKADSGSERKTYLGYGAESVSPEVVRQFAPSPLEPSLSRNIQKLLEVTAPGMGVVAPDGKSLFFSWTVTGTSQVWKLDGPMRFPEQMTSGNDMTSVLEVTPDGRYIILSLDRAGEENPGLYLQSVDGGPLREIQHKKGVRTQYVWVSAGADTIYYLANDIKPDSFALYQYSIASGAKELLFSEPGLWSVADVNGDGQFLLRKSTGALTAEYWRWGVMERKLYPVIGQGELGEYDVMFSSSDGEYLVLTPKFGDFDRLYRFKDGKFTPITPDVKYDVSNFAIDHSRTRIYIDYNEQGYSRLEVLDARTFTKLALPEFKGAEHVYFGKISRFGRYVTLGAETSVAPRSSYVFDWKTLKLTQWLKPSLPEVARSKFAKAKLEFYPARDGTKIPMLVTRPEKCAADPCPVVVHFHGGPEGQSRPVFNRTAQLFAMSGFIFVEPNVRGSQGYGRAWLRADDGAKRLDVITDIEDCAKYLKTAYAAKDGRAPKIGVMGWSYGGYSTLMAMTRFAGAYDAGAALVGMSNLRSFLLNTAPYRRILRISEYGDPERDKDALEKLSATSYLDRIKDPLMIIQGVSDPRVPAGEAIQIHDLLKARGVESQLILLGDEGHGTVKRDNRVIELGQVLRFFQKYLLGS